MIDNMMNDYGYRESGVDNTLMNNVLNKDNTVGLGKNTISKTEGSWPFDQTNHSNGSTPMGTLDIMSFYKKEPTGDYMYFEAAEANSTVAMMSTLETAPDLEYSTDGETWQEWQHTTQDMGEMSVHLFDTITLTAIGDRVYLRGNNPNGLDGNIELYEMSFFLLAGSMNSGGSVTSLIDRDGVSLTSIPDNGLSVLFGGPALMGMQQKIDAIITPPSLGNVSEVGTRGLFAYLYMCTSLVNPVDMSNVTSIGNNGCELMYYGCTYLTSVADMPTLITIGDNGCSDMYGVCTSLTSAADMPALTTIGDLGCAVMYGGCTFNMSSDGTTLNFDFPTPPITTTGDDPQTYNTAYDLAEWMGNTNGFASQTGDYLYFEAAEANSTVSMMSTLETAPNLEYSTDGINFQEWQHTTTVEDDVQAHTFDQLTLVAVGDRVYFRGINERFSSVLEDRFSAFLFSGLFNAGGDLMSIVNNTGEPGAFVESCMLFADMSEDCLRSAPTLSATSIPYFACTYMFMGQSLSSPMYIPYLDNSDLFPEEISGEDASFSPLSFLYGENSSLQISNGNIIASIPNLSLPFDFSFYADPAYTNHLNADNVAILLGATGNMEIALFQGRELSHLTQARFYVPEGLNIGTQSMINVSGGRVVTLSAVGGDDTFQNWKVSNDEGNTWDDIPDSSSPILQVQLDSGGRKYYLPYAPIE